MKEIQYEIVKEIAVLSKGDIINKSEVLFTHEPCISLLYIILYDLFIQPEDICL